MEEVQANPKGTKINLTMNEYSGSRILLLARSTTSNSNEETVEIGFEFSVVHRDAHLIEVHVSAWNGAFGGATNIYVGLDKFGEVVRSLEGFPTHFSDTREVVLGATGPGWAGGGMTLRFFCLDRAGHISVETSIVSSYDSSGPIQSVKMVVPIEPAAVDSFVGELRRLIGAEARVARLRAPVTTTD